MKLILGTAQIGKKYGILNKKKIEFLDLQKVSNLAVKSKISFLDTAFDYKNSHNLIAKSSLRKFKIISKIKLKKKNKSAIRKIRSTILNSLKKLKIKNFYAILIHDSKDILSLNGKILLNELHKLKKEKKILKIGVSIYSPSELDEIWKIWKPEIVQAPINVFDQRILTSGWLNKLKKKNVIIIARSCFLQGLLLTSFTIKNFLKYKKLLNFWNCWCKKNRISKLKACLDFLRNIKEINYIVVGFNSFREFEEILLEYKKKKQFVPNFFSSKKLKLIDPRKWKK